MLTTTITDPDHRFGRGHRSWYGNAPLLLLRASRSLTKNRGQVWAWAPRVDDAP